MMAVRNNSILISCLAPRARCHATELVENFLKARGLIARNQPYAGGYITEHYGRPDAGTYAIQIEINRSIYGRAQLSAPCRI